MSRFAMVLVIEAKDGEAAAEDLSVYLGNHLPLRDGEVEPSVEVRYVGSPCSIPPLEGEHASEYATQAITLFADGELVTTWPDEAEGASQ